MAVRHPLRRRWGGLTRLPAVATPRAVAAGTTVMFLTGGGLALASTLLPGGPLGSPLGGLAEIRALALCAVSIGVLVLVVGERLPRWAFHLVLVSASLMVTRGVWVAGDDLSSQTYALLYLLVAVNAFSAASWAAASSHLLLAVTGCTVALASLPTARPAMIVVLVGVLAVVCVFTGRLVRAAGSAEVDALTGLVNRRGLDRLLDAELARAERTGAPLCVAVIDLDHFRRVNDTHGHAGGDRLLQQVARAWSTALPPGAVLTRPGGDEFVVVVPAGTDVADALTRHLRELLPAPVGCSAGVAGYVRGDSASALVGRADEALYAVKRSQRGRTVVAGDPQQPAAESAQDEEPVSAPVDEPAPALDTAGGAGTHAAAQL